MPTYEYRCKDCRHQFDAVQSFTDEALKVCPQCGGALKKVFGSVGITFKGSGFYKNDSRATSSSKSDGGDAGQKGDKVGAAKDSGSSDSSTNGKSAGNGNGSSSSGSGEAAKPKQDGGGKDKSKDKDKAGSGTGAKSSSRSDSGS